MACRMVHDNCLMGGCLIARVCFRTTCSETWRWADLRSSSNCSCCEESILKDCVRWAQSWAFPPWWSKQACLWLLRLDGWEVCICFSDPPSHYQVCAEYVCQQGCSGPSLRRGWPLQHWAREYSYCQVAWEAGLYQASDWGGHQAGQQCRFGVSTGIRRRTQLGLRIQNGSLLLVFALIWVASHCQMLGTLGGGFAHAMGRTMTSLAGYARAQHLTTSRYQLTVSWMRTS